MLAHQVGYLLGAAAGHDVAEAPPQLIDVQHGALVELQSKLFELSLMVTNGRASRNKADMTITWPTGAQIQFTNINDEQSYARHQGRSYTGLFGDEVGEDLPRRVEVAEVQLSAFAFDASESAAVVTPAADVAPLSDSSASDRPWGDILGYEFDGNGIAVPVIH